MGTESDDDQTVTSQVINVDDDDNELLTAQAKRHHHHRSSQSGVISAVFTVLATGTMWLKNNVIPRGFRSNLPLFFWGIMIGVLFTTLFVEHQVMFRNVMTWKRRMRPLDSDGDPFHMYGGEGDGNLHKDHHSTVQEIITRSDSVPTRGKNRVYVGVLTAKKYLHTRSKAVYETWGRQMDKINFFVGEKGGDDVVPPPQLPVIFLKDTSDVDYPPQKKMFSMMKHICKYHLDDYEWFGRADDDLYIRMKQLKRIISSLDSNRMMYMGQPGKGIPEMRAKIGLDGHNFCMGGPGVFLNRLAMKELCPHLDECEADVASNEEDVEIGRCVTKHLHIECTHNWETLKLFYHSYSTDYTEDRPFQGNLVENNFLSTAVTLHYFKLPLLMYRVHRHFSVIDHLQAAQELKNLTNELTMTEKKVSGFYKLAQPYNINHPSIFTRANKVKEWRTITLTSEMTSSPAQVVDDLVGDMLVDIRQVGERAIDVAVISGGKTSNKLEYSHTVNGYMSCDVMDGCNYLFDILFHHKPKHQRRRRKKKRKLRRRREEIVISLRRVELQRGISKSSTEITQFSMNKDSNAEMDYYVIVTTNGIRSRQFESFMRDVYEVLLLSSPTMTSHTHVIVAPTITYYDIVISDVTNNADQTTTSREPLVSEIVEWFKVKHPRGNLVALESSNSTDEAYTRALKWTEDNVSGGEGVVLLTTANLHFDADLLASCRHRSRSTGEVPIFYQPLGLHIFPVSSSDSASSDEQRGFWDPWISGGSSSKPVAPLCGRLNGFASLLGGSSGESSLLSDRLYRKLYAGEAEIFRAPEPNLSAFIHLIT